MYKQVAHVASRWYYTITCLELTSHGPAGLSTSSSICSLASGRRSCSSRRVQCPPVVSPWSHCGLGSHKKRVASNSSSRRVIQGAACPCWRPSYPTPYGSSTRRGAAHGTCPTKQESIGFHRSADSVCEARLESRDGCSHLHDRADEGDYQRPSEVIRGHQIT